MFKMVNQLKTQSDPISLSMAVYLVVPKGYSARGCFSAVPKCFIARQLNLNALCVSRSRKSLSYLLRDRLVGSR